MTVKMFLEKKKGYRVEAGHPWVYDNEIGEIDGDQTPGAIAEVFNFKNEFIGRGIINPASQIRVRLFTRNKNESIDNTLFEKRITAAWEYRKKIGSTENCRVVFSEADFLSGLIVDKFGDVLVLQILSLAIETYKDAIVETLKKLIQPRAIYERGDVPVRAREGLPLENHFLTQACDTKIIIKEPDGVKFHVDIETGQKTGFFLDQKENRMALKPFVYGADVLDCFCYTGSFAMYAAKYGAKSVHGLDQSDSAIALCEKNAELNNVQNLCIFSATNAFDTLNAFSKEGKKFDVVLLDPPAFTKNRAGLAGALRGYKDINLRAMQILKPGGFLVTSSCSHFLSPDLFKEVIFAAALDAHKSVRQCVYKIQAPDHPVLWGVEESLYLKFFILQIL